MYSTLLALHSVFRWLVLASLLFSVYTAYTGFTQRKPFSPTANALRHWTATIAHVQFIIGIILYIKSPTIRYFWSNFKEASAFMETIFFGLVHIALMFISVVVITIGSALAKRRATDTEKYKTMLLWFSITLLLIFIAIPWPFSPLAERPYIRSF